MKGTLHPIFAEIVESFAAPPPPPETGILEDLLALQEACLDYLAEEEVPHA